jgi:hypothetical protein
MLFGCELPVSKDDGNMKPRAGSLLDSISSCLGPAISFKGSKQKDGEQTGFRLR